jgi:hypothetical protein
MKAFKLVEILLALFIFSFLLTIVVLLIINISNFNVNLVFLIGPQKDLLFISEIIKKELRKMETSNLGSYPLEKANNNEIIFYSNIDEDNLVERIRYFFDNDLLKKGIIKPSGNPLSYNPTQEEIKVVLNNLKREDSYFEYFNKDYQNTSDISYIKLIKVNLSIFDSKKQKIFKKSFVVVPRNLRYKNE